MCIILHKRLDVSALVCKYMHMNTSTRRIKRRLMKNGCYLVRHGSDHDIYRHLGIDGIIALPRHRTVSPCVAASIAKKVGWSE